MKEYRNSNRQESPLITDDVLLIFASTAIELYLIQNEKLIFVTKLEKTHFYWSLLKFFKTTRRLVALETEEDQELIFLHPNHLTDRRVYNCQETHEHLLSSP